MNLDKAIDVEMVSSQLDASEISIYSEDEIIEIESSRDNPSLLQSMSKGQIDDSDRDQGDDEKDKEREGKKKFKNKKIARKRRTSNTAMIKYGFEPPRFKVRRSKGWSRRYLSVLDNTSPFTPTKEQVWSSVIETPISSHPSSFKKISPEFSDELEDSPTIQVSTSNRPRPQNALFNQPIISIQSKNEVIIEEVEELFFQQPMPISPEKVSDCSCKESEEEFSNFLSNHHGMALKSSFRLHKPNRSSYSSFKALKSSHQKKVNAQISKKQDWKQDRRITSFQINKEPSINCKNCGRNLSEISEFGSELRTLKAYQGKMESVFQASSSNENNGSCYKEPEVTNNKLTLSDSSLVSLNEVVLKQLFYQDPDNLIDEDGNLASRLVKLDMFGEGRNLLT